MRWIVTIVFTVLLLNDVRTENDWKMYKRKNLIFQVYKSDRFSIDDYFIPVLFKSSFVGIYQMKDLQLENNKIEQIELGAFEGLPNLRTITIRRSNIKNLKAGIFSGLNITELTITDNGGPLHIASDTFDNMRNLETIRLDRCKRHSWNPQWFFNAPSLRNIYSTGNFIQEIPANAFQNLNGDRELNIFFYDNNITLVHDYALRGVKRVNILHLGTNNIKDFNGNCFQNISSIKILVLNYNQISWLNPTNFHQIFAADVTFIEGNAFNRMVLSGISFWASNFDKTIITAE